MADTVTITYLNRQGGGFAERHTLPTGTTVKQFLEKRDIDADDYTIRIVRGSQGGFTPPADEVLQDGDRLSCVPLKIEGAAETITITYLNRNGGGFAERHTLTAGTTVKQFLEKRDIDPDEYTIRIVRGAQGGFTPSADEVLQEGDRLSCVPLKIEGAGC